MNVIILAGGLGTRLHEKTNKIPKPMVKIGRKPMLLHIIEYFQKFELNKFIVCSGYKSHYIKDYFVKNHKVLNSNTFKYKGSEVKTINTGIKTNTGERIYKVKEYLDKNFYITYGDGLSDVDLNQVRKVNEKYNSALTLSVGHPTSRFGEIKLKKNKVLEFNEKPLLKEWINIGYMYGNLNLLNYVKKGDVFEVDSMRRLLKNSELSAHKHEGNFFPVDNIRDLKQINNLLKKGNAFWV